MTKNEEDLPDANNNEQDEGPETPPSWTVSDALTEIFTDRKFLAFADKSVDKIADIMRARNDIEKQRLSLEQSKLDGWRVVTQLFLLYRFLLSSVTLIGLGIALHEHLLPVELVGALLTAVIASLFVPPRKE